MVCSFGLESGKRASGVVGESGRGVRVVWFTGGVGGISLALVESEANEASNLS
jgi:hypothetical protein